MALHGVSSSDGCARGLAIAVEHRREGGSLWPLVPWTHRCLSGPLGEQGRQERLLAGPRQRVACARPPCICACPCWPFLSSWIWSGGMSGASSRPRVEIDHPTITGFLSAGGEGAVFDAGACLSLSDDPRWPREPICVLSLQGDDALRSPMKKTFLLHFDGKNPTGFCMQLGTRSESTSGASAGATSPRARTRGSSTASSRFRPSSQCPHLSAPTASKRAAKDGGARFHGNILAKPGHRTARTKDVNHTAS